MDHKSEHFPQSKQSIKSCDLSHRHGDFTANARNANSSAASPASRRDNLRHACRPLDFLSLIPPFNLSRSRHASISTQCISVALSARGGTDGKLLRPCLPLALDSPVRTSARGHQPDLYREFIVFSPLRSAARSSRLNSVNLKSKTKAMSLEQRECLPSVLALAGVRLIGAV